MCLPFTHKYQYYNKVVNPPFYESDTDYYKYRMCSKCGKVQAIDIHCLGLNPPEYTFHWNTMRGKPKFRKVGGALEIIGIGN